MSDASEYMAGALADLDAQLGQLQARLTGDAQALADVVAELALSDDDAAALMAAADRVSATADLVGGMARPSAVADEDQPDVTVDPVTEIP